MVGRPALDEVFVGVMGEGATKNGQPIQTPQQTRLDQSILSVNKDDKIQRDHPNLFDRLMQAWQNRRFTSDC
ncbi:hypothetical protein [Ruegeria sp. HKCCD5851]|uniref:hypothetical protein n=1 Tax=unclassified Ruegeria TaxID=2625375 RepID=UPI003530233A